MQPIYNKLIEMWSNLGYPLPIQEGTYWLDNGIIKASIKSLVKYVIFINTLLIMTLIFQLKNTKIIINL